MSTAPARDLVVFWRMEQARGNLSRWDERNGPNPHASRDGVLPSLGEVCGWKQRLFSEGNRARGPETTASERRFQLPPNLQVLEMAGL
jgi:hypothetical protein